MNNCYAWTYMTLKLQFIVFVIKSFNASQSQTPAKGILFLKESSRHHFCSTVLGYLLLSHWSFPLCFLMTVAVVHIKTTTFCAHNFLKWNLLKRKGSQICAADVSTSSSSFEQFRSDWWLLQEKVANDCHWWGTAASAATVVLLAAGGLLVTHA